MPDIIERAAEIIGQDYGPYANRDGIDASVIAARRLAAAGLLAVDAERALADDLANVLDYILHAENGEGERVLARYREARGR
jgi:hypothetical protein